MGLPRGIRNNNPGNIRKTDTKWLGERVPDPEFEEFETMEYGLRALMKTLLNYIKLHNLKTVPQIIGRYAPSNENDTNAYINTVLRKTGWTRDYVVKPVKEDILKLAKAICFVENGGEYIKDEQLEKAWRII